MPGYTKLFHTIVTSTIWQESDQTRIVWVTLLALADKNGEVSASVPGLAHIARVPLPAVEAALAKLAASDPYSRTPDENGKRIEEIPGGWLLLNHAKYRKMANLEDQKIQNARRQARFRESNARVTEKRYITKSNGVVTQSNDIAEAEAEVVLTTSSIPVKKKSPPPAPPTSKINQLYDAYPRHIAPVPAKRAILKALALVPFDALLSAVKKFAASSRLKDPQFIPHPASWFNAHRWEDSPDRSQPRENAPTQNTHHSDAETIAARENEWRQATPAERKVLNPIRAKLEAHNAPPPQM